MGKSSSTVQWSFFCFTERVNEGFGRQLWVRYDEHRRTLIDKLKAEKDETDDEIRSVILKRKLETIRSIGRTNCCEIVSSLTGAMIKRKVLLTTPWTLFSMLISTF